MPPLKEWQPKLRLSHKDNKMHLAYAHRESMKGKNCRTRNLVIVLLYQRWFTKHLYTGLCYEELVPLLGPTVSAGYMEDRMILWTQWGYLKREPSVNPKTHRLIYLYSVEKRGKHLVEEIIPRQKLAEYVAILIDAHRLLEAAQSKEVKPNDLVK
jgi:hypothetical protein